MDEGTLRKRPRPVVSCWRCRDKKLKCDRTSPCENCVKAWVANTCTYNRNSVAPTKIDSVALANGHAHFGSLEDLQRRMAEVESILGIIRDQSASQIIPRLEKQSPATPVALGTVVVTGDCSVYHGQNDRVTLLNQFLDVKHFINDMSKHEQLQASAKQVRFLQGKSQSRIVSPDSIHDSDISLALLKLREFLPPKLYCDRLVEIYFRYFERTMRILHIPTFRTQYEKIWQHNHSEICSSSSIIPQLTAVMTMAHHMDDTIPDDEDLIHKTYLKGASIDLVQAWLDELGRKQKTELSTLQVEVLLLLSRSLRHLYPEKLWNLTGALVRSAMVMGLHTDPTGVSGITPYHIEMRRRLWATILEMDLQASMTAGMPLVVPRLDSSNVVPANLDDSDFDEFSTKLPTSRPLNNLTDNLYQVVLATSLPQRLQSLSLVQRSAPDTKEAIELGRKVEDCLARKPLVLSLHHTGSAQTDGGALLHRVLLDLYLRRPLLCLYKPLLLGEKQDQAAFVEIQSHCLASSLVILSYQELYTAQALDFVTNNPLPQQNFFYKCCKTDILWAALTSCQQIKLNRQAIAENLPLDRQAGHDEHTLIQTIESTIDCLVNRIGRKGSDLKDIVFLSLALQSVQLPEPMPGRSLVLQQSAQKTLTSCRERLLQPMVMNERSHAARPMKRQRRSTFSTSHNISPAMSNPNLTPTSMHDLQLSTDIPERVEQYFDNSPDLAAEFTNSQADMFNSNDALNFDTTQDWNWEHLWQ